MNIIDSYTVTDEIETQEAYDRNHIHYIRSWEPENGASFKSLGRATGWLKKLLAKDGWPNTTHWKIQKSYLGGISVYQLVVY